MTAPDITELWQMYKEQRDNRARDALINHYAYLVKITAGRITASLPPNVEREDLISAGMIGLIQAIDQFDTTRQVKFETYAIALIRGAILEMLRKENWVTRSVRERATNLERTYLRLERTLGRPAGEEEVAEALGIELDDLYSLLADTGRATLLSLDDVTVGADGNERIHLGDVINADAADTSADVEFKEMRWTLDAAIERLPERERLVISLYYYEGLTFKEIGKVLSVSESRVYQLHTQAVLRLRGYLAYDAGMPAPPRPLDRARAQTLDDAERLIDQVRANFHDLASRLAYFIDFKEACRRLCEIKPTGDTDQWHNLAIILFESVKSLYAENLSLGQVYSLRYALLTLQDKHPTRWTVGDARRALAEAGLQTSGVDDQR